MEMELCLTTRHLLHSIVRIVCDGYGAFVTAKNCTREPSSQTSTPQWIASSVVKAYLNERKTIIEKMQCNQILCILYCFPDVVSSHRNAKSTRRNAIASHPAMSVPHGHRTQEQILLILYLVVFSQRSENVMYS